MKFPSFRLFARPSFLEGVAHLVDFTGALNQYNWGRTPEESDFLSLQSDWEAVGDDMRAVMGLPVDDDG